MHDWQLFRLAVWGLMLGILLAAAIVAYLRDKHRKSRDEQTSGGRSRPVTGSADGSLTHEGFLDARRGDHGFGVD